MAATPGGLTANIRRKLQEGKTADEIVQELVAGGLGQASAQRFVDRAMQEDTSAPFPTALPDSEAPTDSFNQFIETVDDEDAKASRGQLWIASALMTVGIVITAGSYIMANAGERYVATWGLIIVGALMWGRSVFSGLQDRHTFPWSTALASLAVPMVLSGAAYGYVTLAEPEIDSELQAQMDEIFEASKAPTAPKPDAITITESAPPPNLPMVEQLLYLFDNTRSGSSQCEMARRLSLVQSDDKADAVTGLVGRFGLASEEVKVCITRAVQTLDPKAAATLNSRQ